ncbi:MAG: hypothetical protein ABSH22_13925 [Tepidisphaeraceae bacterium]|jgi:hypothetical protein
MIKFPCLCGNNFQLADNMAGEMFQCAQCGRLVTVPSLDDLAYLGNDGTYNVEETKKPKDRRVEHPMHPEDSALERPFEEASEVGIPLEGETVERVAPRYDPFTGELIRPHAVEEHVQSFAARAAPRVQPISKSKMRGVIEAPPPHSWLVLLGEMFMARNVAVLGFMFLLNAVLGLTFGVTVGIGLALFFFVPVLLLIAATGYYSIIVQETGPGQSRELPRPLRDFEFRSDMWEPFFHLAVSVGLCFAPAAIVAIVIPQGAFGNAVFLVVVAFGAFMFPAVFLTASVDGTIANFRPDRLMAIITSAKFAYLPVVVAWSVGIVFTADGMAGLYNSFIKLFAGIIIVRSAPSFLADNGEIGCAFIAGGLYLSYYACWQLGMVWRMHYKHFKWVAQVYEKPPEALPPGAAGAKSSAGKGHGAKPA